MATVRVEDAQSGRRAFRRTEGGGALHETADAPGHLVQAELFPAADFSRETSFGALAARSIADKHRSPKEQGMGEPHTIF